MLFAVNNGADAIVVRAENRLLLVDNIDATCLSIQRSLQGWDYDLPSHIPVQAGAVEFIVVPAEANIEDRSSMSKLANLVAFFVRGQLIQVHVLVPGGDGKLVRVWVRRKAEGRNGIGGGVLDLEQIWDGQPRFARVQNSLT